MPRSAQQIADATARLDRFAELLSLDIPIPQICERMGIGKGSGFALMMKLREKYGWQAQ
jgi:hypothetical protein